MPQVATKSIHHGVFRKIMALSPAKTTRRTGDSFFPLRKPHTVKVMLMTATVEKKMSSTEGSAGVPIIMIAGLYTTRKGTM